MNSLKILFLLALSVALCVILYEYGQTKYCRYERDGGWGYDKDGYYGETLEDEKQYKYVGTRYRFDKQSELRSIAIIFILGAAVFFSFRIIERTRRKNGGGQNKGKVES